MKLTDRDLVGIIKAHREDSLGAEDGDLSTQRATAMNHYHGRPYGTEVDGRSQVVSRDLAEAVDWALPAVVRAFVQSGKLAEFDPVGPEDEDLAQQESDYTNHVLLKKNPGFVILHDLVKDAMLLKNCYVKHFWQVEEKVSEEDYTGLSIEGVQKLLTDLASDGAKVEIKGQDSTVSDGVEVFSLKLQIRRKCGKLVCAAVPPEEVRVSKRCRGSLQDSPFTEHVTRKTRSELIEMGMDRGFVDSLPAYDETDRLSEQPVARDTVTDEGDWDATSTDRSMDEIQFCEAYIRVDFDDDGVAELRKVVTCADRIPPGEQWNEPIEAVPMSGGVIKRVPHRHVGESLDDELADLQEIKTTLVRQMLDNIYLTNTSQWMANERVNLEDLLRTTPGGVKRVRGETPIADAIAVVPHVSIIDKILPAVDYMDKVKETRTGIRPGSDLDPDVLKATTKGAFLEHLNRASQKIEMITRLFAETVVKEWVLQAHAILIRHQDHAQMVQLRGKWVPVNPQEWKERTDLTVRVGLGTGNEEEKRQKLMLLAQLQVQLLQAATIAPPPIYAKGYALFEDMANAMGFEMAEKYAIAPSSPEYAAMRQQIEDSKGADPELMKEQAKGQVQLAIEDKRTQTQIAGKRAELEVQAANDARDAERQERQLAAEHEREIMRLQAEDARHQREMEFKRWEKELDAAVQVQTASMQAQATTVASQTAEREIAEEVKPQGTDNTAALTGAVEALRMTMEQMGKPRKIVRGPDGRAEGIV